MKTFNFNPSDLLYFFTMSHEGGYANVFIFLRECLKHLVVESFLSFLSRFKYDTTSEEGMTSQLKLTYRPTRTHS